MFRQYALFQAPQKRISFVKKNPLFSKLMSAINDNLSGSFKECENISQHYTQTILFHSLVFVIIVILLDGMDTLNLPRTALPYLYYPNFNVNLKKKMKNLATLLALGTNIPTPFFATSNNGKRKPCSRFLTDQFE